MVARGFLHRSLDRNWASIITKSKIEYNQLGFVPNPEIAIMQPDFTYIELGTKIDSSHKRIIDEVVFKRSKPVSFALLKNGCDKPVRMVTVIKPKNKLWAQFRIYHDRRLPWSEANSSSGFTVNRNGRILQVDCCKQLEKRFETANIFPKKKILKDIFSNKLRLAYDEAKKNAVINVFHTGQPYNCLAWFAYGFAWELYNVNIKLIADNVAHVMIRTF